uniref:Ste20-related kinase adaptor alpha n=1 Tax=Nothobranchius kuhntae TaxID=321403 RepID=A0A1A8HPN0_NOTKU
MLLEKLNGTVPCLLDTTTIPPEELSLKPSRSGADSGICEGPRTGGVRHSNGDPSSSSGGHPYNRTFSPHFHNFVELCLQRDPVNRPSAATLISHPFIKQLIENRRRNYRIRKANQIYNEKKTDGALRKTISLTRVL